MKPLFISRDGVINERKEGGINQRSHISFVDGSLDALAALSKKGFTVIIVTFQPGLSKGLLDLDEMEAMHAMIIDRVETRGGEIEGVFYCPHSKEDHCYCRPPATGLLDVIEMELDCDISDAFYFCDNEEEAAVATEKGCQPILCSMGESLWYRIQSLGI
ncbi:MAG: D-glycero-D-manno-heptose 1,7-bisphosphate phosphatase [Candidatus Endobugula sp.]|jgi:D-glycero-D-manno-heptose 1,7-bisphosphate phosphatase